jgi:hypothetical protein
MMVDNVVQPYADAVITDRSSIVLVTLVPPSEQQMARPHRQRFPTDDAASIAPPLIERKVEPNAGHN